MKIISISAKCDDLFDAILVDKKDGIETVVGKYGGYVPEFMPGKHYGNYIELEIDIDTGKIVNWKKPTKKQLKEVFSDKKVTDLIFGD